MQYYLKKYLSQKITHDDVDEVKEIAKIHEIPFNEEGFRYIVDCHNGKLPVRIKAAPEGTLTPERSVLFTVESTDKEVPWITSFIETLLLKVWYPCSVASRSFEI